MNYFNMFLHYAYHIFTYKGIRKSVHEGPTN